MSVFTLRPFHFECIPLCISRNYFCSDFLLGLLILILSFVGNLKLNVFVSSQMDYFMF